MLNLDDFAGSGVGEDGLIDLRMAGLGEAGGEIARIGAGAGAEVRIVGAGPCLIEERIVLAP